MEVGIGSAALSEVCCHLSVSFPLTFRIHYSSCRLSMPSNQGTPRPCTKDESRGAMRSSMPRTLQLADTAFISCDQYKIEPLRGHSSHPHGLIRHQYVCVTFCCRPNVQTGTRPLVQASISGPPFAFRVCFFSEKLLGDHLCPRESS